MSGCWPVVEFHLLREWLVEPFAHDAEHGGVVVEDAISGLVEEVEVEETVSLAGAEELFGFRGVVLEEAREIDGFELGENDGGLFDDEGRHFGCWDCELKMEP